MLILFSNCVIINIIHQKPSFYIDTWNNYLSFLSCINIWDIVYYPFGVTLPVLSPCSFLLLMLFSEGILVFFSVLSNAKTSMKPSPNSKRVEDRHCSTVGKMCCRKLSRIVLTVSQCLENYFKSLDILIQFWILNGVVLILPRVCTCCHRTLKN